MRIRLLVLAAGLMGLALAALPGAAGAKTVWLCKPGAKPNPCRESLKTTVFDTAGASHVENPRNARSRRSTASTSIRRSASRPTNANKNIDPQQTAIAQYQASRFSQRCRVFAPVYRQLTLPGIFATAPSRELARLAYSDVLEAWQDYLRKFNHGRGVVLIGHSQGTGMLR